MSRRRYFVHYWNDFGNTYELYYTDSNEDLPEDFERITRKEALHLCAMEKERRRTDPAFSGYASTVILPYLFYGTEEDVKYDPDYYLNGCIWERR